MEWVLHPIVMATAMQKMGIMATGGGVYIVMAIENKNDLFYFPLPSQCDRALRSHLLAISLSHSQSFSISLNGP